MSAIQFIKDHGVEKAREVVEGAPDKTATHYVFRKIPRYYSVEFQSWYHACEWWDSDCHTEQDLIDSYGYDFVVNLSVLKSLVLRLDLIDRLGGINKASELFVKYQHLGESCFQEYLQCSSRSLEQAIADYEAIYGGEHV